MLHLLGDKVTQKPYILEVPLFTNLFHITRTRTQPFYGSLWLCLGLSRWAGSRDRPAV